MLRDIWSPTAFVRTLKYVLEYDVKQKAIVYHLNLIGKILQANFQNRVFVKLDSTYVKYFQNIIVIFEES